MGCDIHACLEVKLQDKWYLIEQPDIGRCYELFAKMTDGNVRSSYPPTHALKGLPLDVCPITSRILSSSDLHSHHWLDSDELDDLMVFLEIEELKPDFFWTLHNYDDYYLKHHGFDDYRLVFAFDD